MRGVPTSTRRAALAGTPFAAPTASTSDTPAACRFRTPRRASGPAGKRTVAPAGDAVAHLDPVPLDQDRPYTVPAAARSRRGQHDPDRRRHAGDLHVVGGMAWPMKMTLRATSYA